MMFGKMKNEGKKCNNSRLCLHKKERSEVHGRNDAHWNTITFLSSYWTKFETERKKKSNHKQRGTLSEFLKEDQHCCSRVVHQGQISLVAPIQKSPDSTTTDSNSSIPLPITEKENKRKYLDIFWERKKKYRMASSWPTKPLIGTLGQRPKNGIKTTKSRRNSINKRKCIKWVDSGLRTQK